MKYILTNENDEIFNISETQGFQENGNYLMNEGLEGEVAIPQSLVKGTSRNKTKTSWRKSIFSRRHDKYVFRILKGGKVHEWKFKKIFKNAN